MDVPFPDHAQIAHVRLIEELYAKYLESPESVDPSWRHFFEGIDFASFLTRARAPAPEGADCRIFELVQAYRRHGHLMARFNPLEAEKKEVPELSLERFGFSEGDLDRAFPSLGFCSERETPLREILEALQRIYSSRIGFECMDLDQAALELWVQRQIEPKLHLDAPIAAKRLILEHLNKSEILETFLHTKYVGQTRFSLEGAETMIPILAELIDRGAELGMEECLIGMAHRGRLNVLANILNKPFSALFEEFEDDTTLSYAGSDDVKYHMGFIGQVSTRSGKSVRVSLAANPSHLESVDPVVLGQTRARQAAIGDEQKKRVTALLIHGDASLAGQGVIYETLQLMKLPDYSVGGTIHLVVNNQIGYTTMPKESRSTRYCTDIAKTFGAPVFHVNAEDPESCLFAAKWAVEIRQSFQCDVFIDLVCYRKYGHNEGDEPAFTQPLQYRTIRAKTSIRKLYFEQLLSAGHTEQKIAEDLEAEYKEKLTAALSQAQAKIQSKEPSGESTLKGDLFEPVATRVEINDLRRIIEHFCEVPSTFHPNPKLKKWLQERLMAVKGNGSIDWATGECLAFGSILMQKIPVRLAGQDSKRGTFSQRHIVWTDMETGETYSPLSHLSAQQGRFDAVNSPLTEFAGMAFEYGYTWANPDALVLWEAQYGDFDNGAQIVIDQYIVSAEQKWNTPSSIVLLLPHAYEGAGPEHSSARLERFLQLSAQNNIQVVNASTPAQYFHVLRRQALRKIKRPLILFTPKSLLRAPACVSPMDECTAGQFEEILDDPTPPRSAKRLLLCSGKIFYDLLAEREKRKQSDAAIVRLEQLYPLHTDKLKKILEKYPVPPIWVQEEPENAGAWNYIRPLLPPGLRYVGRPASPTTATGSHKKHKQEQQALLDQAFEGVDA